MLKSIVTVIIICTLVQSCSLISMNQKHYKNDLPPAPKEKMLSFESQEAMRAGTTLNSVLAAEIYYKGTEAESKKAKMLYDLSYRFLAFIGVNNNFDPSDPESLEKTFEAADKAIAEKEQKLAEFREEADNYRTQLEGTKKIVRDKEAEMEAQNGKWSAKMGAMFYGIIGFIILLVVGAIVLQSVTGIPIFTGLLTGSIKTAGSALHQTIKGVSAIREELRANRDRPDATPEEKEAADKWLGKLDNTLSKHQDQSVKSFINKLANKKSKD